MLHMYRKQILTLIILSALILGFISACQNPNEVVEAQRVSTAVIDDPTRTSTAKIVKEPGQPTPSSTDLVVQESEPTPPITTMGITEESGPVNATPSADIIMGLIEQVDQDRAMTDLRRLTGVEPICANNQCHTIVNRQTGSVGLQWAKDYVYEELTRLGYSIEIQNWTRNGYADQNLIARKPGVVSPDDEIYIVAHLDGVDSPAADDDATGSVALLELARVISSHAFSNTLVLFFSTGEEHGALGVRSYVNQLTAEQLGAIRYVVTVEMLGYDSNNDGAMQLWSGDQPLDFVQTLSEIINTYQLGLAPQIVTGCG